MEKNRKVEQVLRARPTIEGAGVHLLRAFGFHQVPNLDPFLLLDDFHSSNPDEYIKGFPWHPHRGIETITYVLTGEVEHGDSMGNRGTIAAGDVQWMTAGSGIIHQEMPKGDLHERLAGFQLWANLPASQKMMPPRYREVKSGQIPEVRLENGVSVKIVCGEVSGVRGPVTGIVIDPEFLDVQMPANTSFDHYVPAGHTAFAYCFQGRGIFGEEENSQENTASTNSLVVFGDGDQVAVRTGVDGIRFLLLLGKPIREPVAWNGPIVMNTQEELQTAFEELQRGTFLK